MHFRTRYKKIFNSMIGFMLCLVMILSAIPLYLIAFAAPTTEDQEWITAANDIIEDLTTDTWTTYLTSKFYEAAPFASDDSGELNWSSVSLPAAQTWDGTEAGNPLPTVSGYQISFDGFSTYTYNGIGYASELEAQQAAAMANPDMIAPLNVSAKIYYVYSPQQLLYAFRTLNDTSSKTGYTVEIMRDLDMNGMNWHWPTDVSLEDYTTINGNGCVIYNLGMLSSVSYTAMISQCTALRATSLTFSNANICNQKTGVAHTAVFIARPFPGNQTALANYWKLDSISFKDCMVVSRSGETGTLFGRFQCNASVNTGATIRNCNVQGSLVTGLDHIGTLTGPILRFGLADKCFSVECTNISYGIHSGGLFSCMGGMDRCSRCFVDAKVFGRSQTGVFTGNTDKVTKFYDCYSSGFIEGQDSLGGFNGSVDGSGTTVYYNCYSTALVGLRSSGSGLGGFFGRSSEASGKLQAFVNCYAAGEVGSADTISTGATAGAIHQSSGSTPTADYVGGFAGVLRAPQAGATPNTSVATVLAYCYYDKQTTAMREWDLGKNALQISTTRTSSSVTDLSETALGINCGSQGLRGVLTTDTGKAGTGLTGIPTAGTGFTGFADLTSLYNDKGIGYAPGWDYTAANHYPELNCMANASEAEWGKEYYQLVRAYSRSSTSCPQLETWEEGLNIQPGTKNGPALSETTYDTVRDLTIRFDLTTEGNQKWQRTGTATGVAGTDKTTVTIVGVTKDVLNLNRPTVAGNPYYCDQFAPGIEWLETEVKVGDVVATRRFRVMPTAGVEAGPSQTIYRPGQYAPDAKKDAAYYDHANDVELYFSTAGRMDADLEDITTGIYPDKGETGADYSTDHMTRDSDPLTSRQLALIPGSSSSEISSYFDTHGNDSYGNSGTSSIYGLDASFMARAQATAVDAAKQDNNANASKLFIYVRDVSASIGADGSVDDNSPLIDMTDGDYAKTYNGQALKSKGDQILMFEYVWQLHDGRLIYDAKLITVKATPFDVKISVFDAGGLDGTDANRAAVDTSNGLQDTDDALVGAQRLNGEKTDAQVASELVAPTQQSWAQVYANIIDDIGNPLPNPKGEGNLTAENVGPEYGDASLVSWKVTNPEKVVTRLHLKMDSGRKDDDNNAIFFETTIDDPKEGDDVVIPYEFYRVITSSDGSFFVSIEKLNIDYTVKYDSVKETYYLAFNHNETAKAEDNPELVYDADVVDVANNIQAEIELSAKLEVKKTVTGTLGDQLKDFAFTLTLTNDQVDGSPEYAYYIQRADDHEPPETEDPETHTPYTIKEGTAVTVNLCHGEMVVIPGLHYGATYTVAEASYTTDGYTTKADGVISNAMSGALTVTAESPTAEGMHSADRLHKYVNTRAPSPPTGVILDIRPFLLLIALTMGIGCCFVGITLWERRKRRRF